MNKFILGVLVGLPILMSGCATALLNEQKYTSSNPETGLALNDVLIAVGTPAKPIKGYENALAIAGQKYSYLVQPSTMLKGQVIQNPLNLKRILTEVDLQNLTVGQFRRFNGAENKNDISVSSKFNLTLYDTKKATNHTIEATEIFLILNKQTSLFKAGEIKNLETLGFKCVTHENMQRCLNKGYVDITVAKAVSNQNQLQHVLKVPLELDVGYRLNNQEARALKRKVLKPLAIVFDIVTSPIQLVGYLALTSAMSP